jgi:hypothetical protein
MVRLPRKNLITLNKQRGLARVRATSVARRKVLPFAHRTSRTLFNVMNNSCVIVDAKIGFPDLPHTPPLHWKLTWRLLIRIIPIRGIGTIQLH